MRLTFKTFKSACEHFITKNTSLRSDYVFKISMYLKATVADSLEHVNDNNPTFVNCSGCPLQNCKTL